MSIPKLKAPKIDTTDLRMMMSLVLPILLLLSLDYMFQDFWDSLTTYPIDLFGFEIIIDMKYVTFFCLLVATAWAYWNLVKKVAK